jgi:acylphosphatase
MRDGETDSAGKMRVYLLISGRVQGVGFRYFTQKQARALGVAGWVRNRADGRVEAVMEGARSAVDKAVAWCRIGPPGGYVSDVAIQEEAPTGEFQDFSIRW